MIYIIIYFVVSNICEALFLIGGWKEFKELIDKNPSAKIVYQAVTCNKSFKKILSRTINWYTYPIILIIFIWAAPFIFPFTLYYYVKKRITLFQRRLSKKDGDSVREA